LKKFDPKDQNEKSARIEGLSLNLTRFGANFHLNERAHFGKNNAVSSTVHFLKKNPETMPF